MDAEVWYKIGLYVIPLGISAALVPLVKRIAWKLNIFAVENKRTVHHGKIARVGGIAVYIAFIITSMIFLKADVALRGILLGGFVIFLGGLLDDIYDLNAWIKLMFQSAGAIILMTVGKLDLGTLHLPFGLVIPASIFSYIITFFWIIGITNAINLLDGLDGLSSGFSIIVLFTICLLTTVNGRVDVLKISLILAGATTGFLFYNFHPASIFIGDCGAQFLGFMIAAISLLGFKGGTVITMMIPIILLFLPIIDTLSAILRRKLNGHKFSDPDMGHFHHALMRTWGLGQRETVLIIYAITALFGFDAYLYAINSTIGLLMLVVLIIACDLFIEITGMVTKKYHPLLSLLRKIKHVVVKEDKKDEKPL